jgi:Ca2+:H+ antiporter
METRLTRTGAGNPWWTWAVPLAALAALAAAWGHAPAGLWVAGIGVALVGAVFAAVHHAEIVALRVGEPFGTLVLALAVTVIEVALIGALMLGGGPDAPTLARDTVYATVMIVCNGVVGLCLVVGSLRHGLSTFRVEGASQALSVLIPLVALALVLPNFTTSADGPRYTEAQIGFVGAMTLALYAVFVFVQTVRHRDYFLPETSGAENAHAAAPSAATALASLALLLVCLVGVVGLAKTLAPRIEDAVAAAGAPAAVVGIAIALLVLLPETVSAMAAARAGRVQTSLNLALGSALATIGLTVPAIGLLAVLLDLPLSLGLPAKEMTLLAVTLLVASVTLAGGRATVLHGAVHLVLFGAFLFLAVVP